MALGVLDLFSIGIGPSSSHTVGRMRAAARFVDELAADGHFARVEKVSVGLFGSLAATGIGHGSDSAVLAGLSGCEPETLDPDAVGPLVAEVRAQGALNLGGRRPIPFDPEADLTLHRRESLPEHPNGMRMRAEVDGTVIEREYFSIGGGFVVTAEEMGVESADARDVIDFSTADELLEQCHRHGLSIAELMAVNEENASGGRIVTAPTNGAAGIIPAVLHYMDRFVPGADDDAVVTFLLTAGAIGILFKRNASISGAEVGCQGEVGSACAMAAAGLCAVLGGSPEQIENAAEIGLEHNLGLTCDPVGGLVQVPCIERNAIASVKAINAARLAMHGDGSHRVSLDQAIETMRQTGADMKSKYKETSLGGLAVNVIEC